jgi:MFS-type transporter involved in bile tolerance (Atg22 family)
MKVLEEILSFLKDKLTSRKFLLAVFVIYGLVTGLVPVEVQRDVVLAAVAYIIAEAGVDIKKAV